MIALDPEEKLILDPLHKTLHDAQGRLLKKIHCPKMKSWEQLTPVDAAAQPQRHCDSCDKAVLHTAAMSAGEILQAVKSDPHTCIHIQPNQSNIEIMVIYV